MFDEKKITKEEEMVRNYIYRPAPQEDIFYLPSSNFLLRRGLVTEFRFCKSGGLIIYFGMSKEAAKPLMTMFDISFRREEEIEIRVGGTKTVQARLLRFMMHTHYGNLVPFIPIMTHWVIISK